MGNVKRHTSGSRCVYNFLFAFLAALFPLIVQKSLCCGFCFMLAVSSFSSCIVANVNKKNIYSKFASSKNEFESSCPDKGRRSLFEPKGFRVFLAAVLSIYFYYLVSIIFGAPVFKDCLSTLYFSCLMTLLTVYPLIWYWYANHDGIAGVFRIFLDQRYENLSESHLHTMVSMTVIGAWAGALPISLDWDREWQVWPLPCCIGATLGYAAAHFSIAVKLLLALYCEKRKLAFNLFV